jgi:hypothetical protein
LLRQAVNGRLAGYEHVNDAERLAYHPAVRAIVGPEGLDRPAASPARWAGSRPSGLRTRRPSRHSRTCPAPGSTACTGVAHRTHWSLTTLPEKLVKIGARIVHHGPYVVFQLAEVAVPRVLFEKILRRIDRLRPRSPQLPA